MSESTTITVRVVPRAAKDEIRKGPNSTIKIRLQAPPVDGKANKALVRLLSKKLDIPQRNIIIISGATSRDKRLEIQGVTEHQIQNLTGGKN